MCASFGRRTPRRFGPGPAMRRFWTSGAPRGRRRHVSLRALGCGILLACAVTATALASPGPGAPGSGDGLFPLAGNGGYEVNHYNLRLSFTPRPQHLRGRAIIAATATR